MPFIAKANALACCDGVMEEKVNRRRADARYIILGCVYLISPLGTEFCGRHWDSKMN
jgi:hypothetical protein